MERILDDSNPRTMSRSGAHRNHRAHSFGDFGRGQLSSYGGTDDDRSSTESLGDTAAEWMGTSECPRSGRRDTPAFQEAKKA